MKNKDATREENPTCRHLLERCRYVHWSLLSVANYPTALQMSKLKMRFPNF